MLNNITEIFLKVALNTINT